MEERMLGDDPEVELLLRSWLNGGSAYPAVRRLVDIGCADEAAATARVALARESCADRAQLEAILDECASAPEGWHRALEDFAREPTVERWEQLLRFVPEEVFYQRLRRTIVQLQELGCDANMLFRCVTRTGMIPDVFDLVATGKVDPEVIEQRGDGSPARPMWLGLAAQAAFARGDRFSTIRYLREASNSPESSFAWVSISEIRHEADEELNRDLDRAGVPDV